MTTDTKQVDFPHKEQIHGVAVQTGFFSMKFRITDDSVETVMPPFKYNIPFSDIKEVKIIENTPWYAGWGLRL